jgi:hypothetical protein
MIYKCTFNDEKCEVFQLDTQGNREARYYKYEFYDEIKDLRLFGFSMDGFETENDKFVACAPKQRTMLYPDESYDHGMFGACYYAENTKSNFPTSQKIAPLRFNSKLLTPQRYPNYMNGESGFSAHILDSKNEMLSGCPGVGQWKGAVNKFEFSRRYYHQAYEGTLSDLSYVNKDILDDDNYFGYAVTSGKFLMPQSDFIYYVSSAPRANYLGTVLIYSFAEQVGETYIKIYNTIKGEEYGSYFGYALVCDDFNGDGKPDLAISAPLYSENGYHENGAVYIYSNRASGNVSTI